MSLETTLLLDQIWDHPREDLILGDVANGPDQPAENLQLIPPIYAILTAEYILELLDATLGKTLLLSEEFFSLKSFVITS